eukprot:gene16510-22736_t
MQRQVIGSSQSISDSNDSNGQVKQRQVQKEISSLLGSKINSGGRSSDADSAILTLPHTSPASTQIPSELSPASTQLPSEPSPASIQLPNALSGPSRQLLNELRSVTGVGVLALHACGSLTDTVLELAMTPLFDADTVLELAMSPLFEAGTTRNGTSGIKL